MKLTACTLLCLVVLCAGAPDLDSKSGVSVAGVSAAQSSPRILKARVEGKKLIIEGEDFNIGAVILLNGKKLKTKNDATQPSNVLVAKKGGKKIPSDMPVALQVKNPGSSPSEIFSFFSGLTITLDDGGKTINLKVGERFMLLLKRENYTWTPRLSDDGVLKLVDDASIIPGAQGVFQAERAGSTRLFAIGELPCHKENPPCNVRVLAFEIGFVVQ